MRSVQLTSQLSTHIFKWVVTSHASINRNVYILEIQICKREEKITITLHCRQLISGFESFYTVHCGLHVKLRLQLTGTQKQ
jgi:hypothetical protein